MWKWALHRRVRRQFRNLFPAPDARASVLRELVALAVNPWQPDSEPVRGNVRLWRIHVGGGYCPEGDRGWRALYTVNRVSGSVYVVHVAHRDVVYRHKVKRYGNPRSTS